MADAVAPGAQTSEFAVTQQASVWGIISTILGFVISGGSLITSQLGESSKWGVIAGAAVAVAGLALKTFTALGYIQARAMVKAAASNAGGN